MAKRLDRGELYDLIAQVAADMADAAVTVTEDAPDLLGAMKAKHKILGGLIKRIEGRATEEDMIAARAYGYVVEAAFALELLRFQDHAPETVAEVALMAALPEVFSPRSLAETLRKTTSLEEWQIVKLVALGNRRLADRRPSAEEREDEAYEAWVMSNPAAVTTVG